MLVITRPQRQGSELLQWLQQQSIPCLHLPGVALQASQPVAEVGHRIQQHRTADWWCFSSSNAVRYAFAALQQYWLAAPEQASGNWPSMAVMGHASEASLNQQLQALPITSAAIKIIQPASGHRSEDLLQHPAMQQLRGQTMVLLNAPGGRNYLADQCKQLGATVNSIHVYQRIAAKLDQNAIQTLLQVSEVITLWTSSASIHNLHRLLPADAWGVIVRGRHLVLSERQAGQLSTLGAARISIIKQTDNVSLAKTLVQLHDQDNAAG